VQRARRDALVSLIVGLAAATIILAGSATLSPRPTPAGCPGLCGSGPLCFLGSVDAASSSLNWYNLSFVGDSPGYTLGRLTFDLHSPGGSNASNTPGAGVNVVGPNGTVEASFSFGASGVYKSGYDAKTPVPGGGWISVFSPEEVSLSGYTLTMYSVPGTCSGTIT
jgi:hypothetical protein